MFLCFSTYGGRRALHSFPTRRSSDLTLPDQVAGMKGLAAKYPWIDIDRAGIYGHSGGGYATADAMFRYPDFFKVGISERSEEHTSELQSHSDLVCRLLLEKKNRCG